MRAYVMQGFGRFQNARLGTLPKPECRAEDVLVRVAAAGVNPTDWKEMEGNLQAFYPAYPPHWAPGFDGAGVVEQRGSEVSEFKVGDSVVFLADRREGQCGTFAEYVRVSRHLTAKAPASITLTQTASIPVAGLTAYQAIFRDDMCALAAGESILVHGAAGGLGSFATSFAHTANAHIAVTSREANFNYLRELGAEWTIDYTEGTIAAAAKQWRPSGVDVVLDATSGGADRALLDALAPGGRLVIIATVTDDGDIPTLSEEAARRGLSVHFLILDHTTIAGDLRKIVDLIDTHHMRMPAITCYPLARAGDALEAIRAGRIRGKLVVEIIDRS